MESSRPLTGRAIEAEVALLCEKMGIKLPEIRYSDLATFGSRPPANWQEGKLRVSLQECDKLDPAVVRHALAFVLAYGNPRQRRLMVPLTLWTGLTARSSSWPLLGAGTSPPLSNFFC